MSRLLLIDDDARLTDMVSGYLRHNGFEVDTAGTLAAGREQLKQAHHDALLLDLMLPDGDGLDFTRELRSQPRTRRLPLLMLTARGEPMDRIVGLEIGADDYLPKPFEPRELLARVKALLRRAAPDAGDDEVLVFGRLEVDLGARQARLAGQACDLTSHQFELLSVLQVRKQKPCTVRHLVGPSLRLARHLLGGGRRRRCRAGCDRPFRATGRDPA